MLRFNICFFTLLICLATASNQAYASEKPSFTIVIKEHKFSPETLTVPAGQKVKLVIDNQDTTAEEFESHELHREKIISGNSKATVFIGPLEPGKYTYFGEFNPETAQGIIIAE